MGTSPRDPRDQFQESLNSAILFGVRPSRSLGLDDPTFQAVDAVAREHPEATADHIAEAYDAFIRGNVAADDADGSRYEAPAKLVARKDRLRAN